MALRLRVFGDQVQVWLALRVRLVKTEPHGIQVLALLQTVWASMVTSILTLKLRLGTGLKQLVPGLVPALSIFWVT